MFFKLSSPSLVSGPSGSSEQMGEGLIGQDNKSGLGGEVRGSLPKETHFLGNVSGWVEHEWMPLKQS